MNCVPSPKVKRFAKTQKQIIYYLRNNDENFDNDFKFIIVALIEKTMKNLNVNETASFVYNYFPNKILEHINSVLGVKGSGSAGKPFTDTNFDREVETSTKPFLINFYSKWCDPCNELAPIWKKLPDSIHDNFNVGEVSEPDNPKLVSRFNIITLPTILLIKDGKEYKLNKGNFKLVENIIDFAYNPETYNNRNDDEVDCSNILKNLTTIFTSVSKNLATDKEYLKKKFKLVSKRSKTVNNKSDNRSRRRTLRAPSDKK
jgi:thioredoxin 1